jgi:TolB-like protein
MQYKKTTKSIKQVGEELGVNYVLSGTIRWQKSAEGPGRVRVTPILTRGGGFLYSRYILEIKIYLDNCLE